MYRVSLLSETSTRCIRGDEGSRGWGRRVGLACSSIMRLNESERKQRPLIPSQKTMALLVEAFGMITWADILMVEYVTRNIHFFEGPLDHVPSS